MAPTGVPSLDASLSHSFKRGPYEGSEGDFPRSGGQKMGEGKLIPLKKGGRHSRKRSIAGAMGAIGQDL
jgi:hypothetical protein